LKASRSLFAKNLVRKSKRGKWSKMMKCQIRTNLTMTLARMKKTQTLIRRMRTSIQTFMMMMKEIHPIDLKVRDDHKWQP
jgi:hypothetical protein